MPREVPKPVWCGKKHSHEAHKYQKNKEKFDCVGYVSPLKVDPDSQPEGTGYDPDAHPIDPDNVDDLNKLWVNIPRLRMELAKLAKDGNQQYPLGEIILLIRQVVREETNV